MPQLCLPPRFRRCHDAAVTLLCTYYRTIVCKAGSKCCAAKVGTSQCVRSYIMYIGMAAVSHYFGFATLYKPR